MRARHPKWQRRALSVAVAVSWVSSTQLVGCLNNPTRTDLAAEAGRAVLKAGDEEQGDRVAESKATTSKPLPGNVVVAGGATPERSPSSIIRTGGEAPTQKSGFWNFWSSKSEKSAISDPFANAPVPKSPSEDQRDASSGSPQSGAAKVRMTSTASNSPEQWFEEEFRRTAALSSWEREAIANSTAAAIQSDDAGIKAGAKGVASSPSNESDRFPPSRSLSRDESPSTTSVAKVKLDDVVQETAPWAQQQSAGASKVTLPATEGRQKPGPSFAAEFPEATANSQSEPSNNKELTAARSVQTPSAAAIQIRKEKLRIQALLSDAHTNQMRGELHAAYRSALLAEKIAKEHRIEFSTGEENPSELARTIAASIWRTSNSSEEAYQAATEATLMQEAAPSTATKANESAEPAKAKSPFDDHLFATWRPLPDNLDQRPAQIAESSAKSAASSDSVSRTHSAALSQSPPPTLDILPEIRPSKSGKGVSQTSPAQELLPPREFDMTTTELPKQEARPLNLPESTGQAIDSGVQFAIAQSVSEPAGTNVSILAPEAIQDTNAISDDQSLAATFGQRRPMLMAPPVPMDMTLSNVEPAPISWEEADQTSRELSNASSRKADTSFQWRMTWAIIGLFGAVVTAVIGIRMSRSEEDLASTSSANENDVDRPQTVSLSTPLEVTENTSSTSDPSDSEVQAIQFKRAA